MERERRQEMTGNAGSSTRGFDEFLELTTRNEVLSKDLENKDMECRGLILEMVKMSELQGNEESGRAKEEIESLENKAQFLKKAIKNLHEERREVRIRIARIMRKEKDSPLNKVDEIKNEISGKEIGMKALTELIAEKTNIRDEKIIEKGKINRTSDPENFAKLSKEIGSVRDEISTLEERNRGMRIERESLISKLDEILEATPRNKENKPQGEESKIEDRGTEMEIDTFSGKRKLHDLSDVSLFLDDDDDDIPLVFDKPKSVSTPAGSDDESTRKLKVENGGTKKGKANKTEVKSGKQGNSRGRGSRERGGSRSLSRTRSRIPTRNNPGNEYENGKGKTDKGTNTEKEELSPDLLKLLKAFEESPVIKGLIKTCQEIKQEVVSLKKEVKEIHGNIGKGNKNLGKEDLIKLKEISENLSKTDTGQIIKIGEELKGISQKIDSTESYAKKAASSGTPRRPEIPFTTVLSKSARKNQKNKNPKKVKILVKSTDEKPVEQESRKIFGKITEKVPEKKVRDKKCRILEYKLLKKGVILEAECEDENKEEILDIYKKGLTGEKVEVRELDRDLATVKFETIPNELNMESFTEGIAKEMNMKIEDVKDGMYVIRRQKAKTWGRSTVIVKLKGELVDKVLKKREFYMGYAGRVIVSPTVFITNCLKCGSVSHSQRVCTKEGRICFGCGSKDHIRKDCKDRFNRDIKCVLCKSEKKPCNHRYMSLSCPAFKEAVKRQLEMEGEGIGEKSLEEYIQDNDELF